MVDTTIIEIVDNVFLRPVDNSSPAPFSFRVLDERDVGELFIVVVATVTVVVATVGNGATDVVLPIDTNVAAVDTGADVVIAAFVVVLAVGAAVVVVAFNKQIRLDVRLPLNELYSLLLHRFQSVQLVPLN